MAAWWRDRSSQLRCSGTTRLHGDGIVPRASPLRYNPGPSSKSQISGQAFLVSNIFGFISIFSIFFLLFSSHIRNIIIEEWSC
jgi:hypothetical protein